MGDTVEADNTRFVVKLPDSGEISLLRNGKIVAAAEGTELSYIATIIGAYRVKVKRKGKPWIYSNHIRFKKAKNNEL